MLEVGKELRSSKTHSLKKLKARLGRIRLAALDRERIIQFARGLRSDGDRPLTIWANIY